MTKSSEQILTGGTMTAVTRAGDTVRRAAGPWTPRVHQLLTYMRLQGITEVPEPLGFDVEGREMLSFLPGTAAETLIGELRTDDVLTQAARVLRRLHDATIGVAGEWMDGWQSPPRQPVEVICHGDFAPYNFLFEGGRLTGVIDFDNTCPGPRMWDISYAIYRFAPVTAPTNPEHFGSIGEQARRARLFCDAYGLEDRTGVVDALLERIKAMADSLREGAARGDKRFQANIDAGHLKIYEDDLAYLIQHKRDFS
ncbi:MAG: aminoglycoside phosphotransferase family protein [Chloroflexi bacterium]|nr:aminoglycoside phosphotransferase family protein [Chloroflexota bacterium]